jgi:iron complex outermembrane receptor protein
MTAGTPDRNSRYQQTFNGSYRGKEMKIRHQVLASVSLLGSCVATVPSAFAQQASGASASEDTLSEVVVTAERRTSTAQRTAAALTVKSGEDMQAEGRYTLRDIIADVPGVTGGEAVNSNTSLGSGTDNAASGLVFRGIPSNLGTGGSITSTASAAAIYVDDVYNGVGGGYDFERVEVLRGPQGTLYGRSATSGVIAIRTKDPDSKAIGADISLEAGTASLRHYSGGVNIPVVADKLAIRLSGNSYQRDGYWISPGDDRKSASWRAKVLITPTDKLSILLGYAHERNDTQSGGGSYSQPTPDQFVFVPATPPGTYSKGTNSFKQYWGQVKWDLGPVAITYIPAVRKWEQDAILSITGIFVATQTIKTPESKFTTHELRFNSNYDSPLQWQFGATHYDNELNDFNEFVALPPTPFPGLRFRTTTQKSTKAYGAFGEATWSFRPDTRLTAGLRYDHTSVQTNQDYTSITLVTKSISGDAGFRKFDNTTYKLRLEHDLTPTNLLYGSVSTGFSPGDVTLGTDAALAPVVVLLDAETLTAYEIGSKNRFLDNRLQLNGAIYYNDYSAYQLANVNFGTPAVPAFLTVALPLKSMGAEIEMLARPWNGGTFGVNLSYTDANFQLSGLPANYQAQFYTKRVYGIPKLRGSVSYDHRLTFGSGIALLLHADVEYRGENDTARIQVPDAAAGFKPYVNQGALALGNLSATLQFADGRYGVTGYARNVTDKRYKTVGGGPTPPVSFVGSATLGDPRTVGVVLNARF